MSAINTNLSEQLNVPPVKANLTYAPVKLEDLPTILSNIRYSFEQFKHSSASATSKAKIVVALDIVAEVNDLDTKHEDYVMNLYNALLSAYVRLVKMNRDTLRNDEAKVYISAVSSHFKRYLDAVTTFLPDLSDTEFEGDEEYEDED